MAFHQVHIYIVYIGAKNHYNKTYTDPKRGGGSGLRWEYATLLSYEPARNLLRGKANPGAEAMIAYCEL